MHPVVFKFGWLVIHSYGLMLALSFLLGIWYASYRAKKNNLDPNVISDVGFWVILSAIVGSRLYYVFLHFDEFKGNLTSIFNPFQEDTLGIGGLVMFGGMIGAILSSYLYFRIKKVAFLPYADAVSIPVGLGIFLTRIGCFLNGCCFGKATESSIGVHFPNISPAGYFQTAQKASMLIPSQLIESAGGLLMAIILLIVGKWKTFVGFQFYLMVVLYAVLRFCVDFTRHYKVDEKIASLSHNQIVCIVFFVVFGGLILKNFLVSKEDSVNEATEQAQ